MKSKFFTDWLRTKMKSRKFKAAFAAQDLRVRLALHLAEERRKRGFTQALVAASGDIVVGDPPPGEAAWKIGVAPLEKPDQPPSRFVWLKNAAVSTSGDAEQFVEIDGKRYSHIVDPKTGLGLVGRKSVTVVAPRGVLADSLATAFCVMGPKKAIALADGLDDCSVLILVKEGDKVREHASKRWSEK